MRERVRIIDEQHHTLRQETENLRSSSTSRKQAPDSLAPDRRDDVQATPSTEEAAYQAQSRPERPRRKPSSQDADLSVERLEDRIVTERRDRVQDAMAKGGVEYRKQGFEASSSLLAPNQLARQASAGKNSSSKGETTDNMDAAKAYKLNDVYGTERALTNQARQDDLQGRFEHHYQNGSQYASQSYLGSDRSASQLQPQYRIPQLGAGRNVHETKNYHLRLPDINSQLHRAGYESAVHTELRESVRHDVFEAPSSTVAYKQAAGSEAGADGAKPPRLHEPSVQSPPEPKESAKKFPNVAKQAATVGAEEATFGTSPRAGGASLASSLDAQPKETTIQPEDRGLGRNPSQPTIGRGALNRTVVDDDNLKKQVQTISHHQNHQFSDNKTSVTTQKFSGKERILDVSEMLIKEKSLKHLRKQNNMKVGALKKMASIRFEHENKFSGSRLKSQMSHVDDQRSQRDAVLKFLRKQRDRYYIKSPMRTEDSLYQIQSIADLPRGDDDSLHVEYQTQPINKSLQDEIKKKSMSLNREHYDSSRQLVYGNLSRLRHDTSGNKQKESMQTSMLSQKINIKRKAIGADVNKYLDSATKNDRHNQSTFSNLEQRQDSLYDSTGRGAQDHLNDHRGLSSTSIIIPPQAQVSPNKFNSWQSTSRLKQVAVNHKDHSKYHAQREAQKIANILKKMDKSEIKLINSQNAIFKKMKSQQGNEELDQQSMHYFLSEPLDFLANVQNQLYDAIVEGQSNKRDSALPSFEGEKMNDYSLPVVSQASASQSLALADISVAGAARRPSALGMNQQSQQGQYSKQLVNFVESVCKNITLSKSLIEKNFEIYVAQQTKKITMQSEMLKQLRNEIEVLKARQDGEIQLMADEDRVKFQQEVDNFLNDTTEAEQKNDDEKDKPKGEERQKVPETQQDIFNLLSKNNYSGAIYNLDEVTRHMKRSQQGIVVPGEEDGARLSTFDKRLLDVNSWFFHRDLQEYLLGAAKDVQWDASKKVISRFFIKTVTQDGDTQTNNQDQQIIEDLEGQRATLQQELEKLGKQLAAEKQDNHAHKRKQDELREIIDQLNSEIKAKDEEIEAANARNKSERLKAADAEARLQEELASIMAAQRKAGENALTEQLEQEVHDLKIKLQEAEAQNAESQSHVTREQSLSESQLHTLSAALAQAKEQLEASREENDDYERRIENYKQEIRELKAKQAETTQPKALPKQEMPSTQRRVANASAEGRSPNKKQRESSIESLPNGELASGQQITEPRYKHGKEQQKDIDQKAAESSLGGARAQSPSPFDKDDAATADQGRESGGATSRPTERQTQGLHTLYPSSLGKIATTSDEQDQNREPMTRNAAAGKSTESTMNPSPQALQDAKPFGQLRHDSSQSRADQTNTTLQDEQLEWSLMLGLSPHQYNMSQHLLTRSLDDLTKSEKILQDFIKRRLSKVDYTLASSIPVDKKRLFFHQGSQTEVDTRTFVRILDTYSAWTRKRANLVDQSVQSELTADGLQYVKYKSPKRRRIGGVSEFAQQVTEKEIKYTMDLLDTQQKNLSYLYGAEPSPPKPLKSKYQVLATRSSQDSTAKAGQGTRQDDALRSQPNEATAKWPTGQSVSNESGATSRNHDPAAYGPSITGSRFVGQSQLFHEPELDRAIELNNQAEQRNDPGDGQKLQRGEAGAAAKESGRGGTATTDSAPRDEIPPEQLLEPALHGLPSSAMNTAGASAQTLPATEAFPPIEQDAVAAAASPAKGSPSARTDSARGQADQNAGDQPAYHKN